jgi:hypothetical protein
MLNMLAAITAKEPVSSRQHLGPHDHGSRSPRIRTLTAIRDQLRPPPVREPLPPLRHYAPPRAGRRRRG